MRRAVAPDGLTLNALRRHPLPRPGLRGDGGLLDAARARALATEIGQVVIDLRNISELGQLSWQSVDEMAERLTAASRAIRISALRAAAPSDGTE